jgi:hypothetical protein
MLENSAEATITKNAIAPSSENSLFNSAYEQGGGDKKSADSNRGGGKSAGSLPEVEIVDDGKKPAKGSPAGGGADAGATAATAVAYPVDGTPSAGRQTKVGKASSDQLPAGATAAGDGTIGGAGSPGISAGMFAPTEAQFKYSKQETAPKALTMFGNDELDLDGNGFVNKTELDRKREELLKLDEKQLGKSKETTEKLQVVNYMTANYDKLMAAHDDEFLSETNGISIHDLATTVSDVNRAKRPH